MKFIEITDKQHDEVTKDANEMMSFQTVAIDGDVCTVERIVHDEGPDTLLFFAYFDCAKPDEAPLELPSEPRVKPPMFMVKAKDAAEAQSWTPQKQIMIAMDFIQHIYHETHYCR